MNNRFIEILLLVLLIGVSVAFAYYYGTQKGIVNNFSGSEPTQSVSLSPTIAPSIVPSLVPTSSLPSGWMTYSNDKYAFEISYPASYKALTDKENLYGWPKGIVLFYKGGQSYDLVIEHWESQSEFENKYHNQTNVVIKKIGNYYISLLNNNFDPEVDQIIGTFKEK